LGLILDTSILIESERRGEGVEDILRRVRAAHGEIDVALSAVSAVELTHGIYRARSDADRERRRVFVEGVFHDLIVHPLTLGIAQLAGRIEGEEAARGVSIAIEDLIIGATALHLGFDVVTLNLHHFQAIPGLNIVSL
jgi:predicted nucleic acid-binding protein